MDTITILGLTAAFFTTFAFLPQVIRVWQLKEARDLALSTFLMFTLGVSLWLVYGILLGDLPVMIANALTLIFALLILFFKLKYK